MLNISQNKLSGVKQELEVKEQNFIALQDSIEKTTNKVGELEYSKSVLVTKIDKLESLNEGLYKEVKKEKHKVNSLTSTVIELRGHIIELETSVTYERAVETEKDTTYTLNWGVFNEYDAHNSRELRGYTKFNISHPSHQLTNIESFLTNDEIQFKLIQGLRERNGVVEIFARSNYPGFEVEEMNVAIIDPDTHPVFQKFVKSKPKQFGFSLYTGYGMTYNFKSANVFHGFQVGLGLYWTPRLF